MRSKYQQIFNLEQIELISTLIIATVVFSINGTLVFHPSMIDPLDNQKTIENKQKSHMESSIEGHIPHNIKVGVSDVGAFADSPKPKVGYL